MYTNMHGYITYRACMDTYIYLSIRIHIELRSAYDAPFFISDFGQLVWALYTPAFDVAVRETNLQ
jgi:hypothetical protein